MLLIYASEITNRFRYITELILTELYGLTIRFTGSPDDFIRFQGPKINYSTEDLETGLFIYASELLFEKNVSYKELTATTFQGMPIFYERPVTVQGFPFDIFAASFYLVSRYEEYLNVPKDKYGRFSPSDSLAYRFRFLDQPMVNIWAEFLIEQLRQSYPGLKTCQPPFRFIPTIDIDHAYAFKCRTIMRSLGGIGRSVSRGRPGEVMERIKVLTGQISDPYDTYAYIRQIHTSWEHLPVFFVLFADYGGNDNNVSISHATFKNLMKELAGFAEMGIHPSLSSNKYPRRLEKELLRMNQVTGKKIIRSRQHFLKFSFPKTFQQLSHLGIQHDFSMGYASLPGFRASIAHPFRFFDLTLNQSFPLLIHPVSLMDVTFRDYQRHHREESLRRMKQIIDQIRNCQGEFVSLWHNESLSDRGRWKAWREVYEKMGYYAIQ